MYELLLTHTSSHDLPSVEASFFSLNNNIIIEDASISLKLLLEIYGFIYRWEEYLKSHSNGGTAPRKFEDMLSEKQMIQKSFAFNKGENIAGTACANILIVLKDPIVKE